MDLNEWLLVHRRVVGDESRGLGETRESDPVHARGIGYRVLPVEYVLIDPQSM